MKHTKRNCLAHDLIIAGECGVQCSNCLACKCGECDRPEYGKQYALTGGKDSKSIMNGNSWKDSLIK